MKFALDFIKALVVAIQAYRELRKLFDTEVKIKPKYIETKMELDRLQKGASSPIPQRNAAAAMLITAPKETQISEISLTPQKDSLWTVADEEAFQRIKNCFDCENKDMNYEFF